MGKPNHFTQEGLTKLKAELEELKGPVRMRVAEAIREAKAHGDLRENAAYHEAKLNQTRLEGRISDLERAIQTAKVVERPKGSEGTAQIGSKVTLLDMEFDDELVLTLVGAFEADPTRERISISSPLGVAITGQVVGAEIEVAAPGGVTKYRVLKVD